jgi:predicted dehydrogenase
MTADSMRSIKVILVGCGAVSQFQYAPALRALERTGELKVAALVDPAERQRLSLLDTFPHASSFADLRDCQIDSSTLVIVASPPKWHAEQTIFGLQHGAGGVLCEKPMASNSAEAETMLKISRESVSVLAVGLFRRFFPAAEMIKSLIDNKPFGELQNFTIQEGEKFGWGAASDSYFRPGVTYGGVLYDIGVHVLDLLIWWFGDPAALSYQDDAMGGIEANCLLELSYSSGVKGTVWLSRDWETRNSYIFSFEKGTVVFEAGYANRLNVLPTGTPLMLSGELVEESMRHTLSKSPTRTNLQSFIEQLRNVVAAIKFGETLRVPGEEGIRSLRLIEKCYANRTLIEMPWLDAGEKRAAEALATAHI